MALISTSLKNEILHLQEVTHVPSAMSPALTFLARLGYISTASTVLVTLAARSSPVSVSDVVSERC
jgi:hypothetical protein